VASGVLLDTCTAIWLMNGDALSSESREAIGNAQRSGDGVYVSPISAWEIATLAAKGRLRLSLDPALWFDGLLSQSGVRLAEMSPKILIDSAYLPGSPPRDPADRILAATCRHHGFLLITRDGELLPYGQDGHLRVMAC
jgi:PIN domain nuclease of toxin-antitoxin system